MILIERFVKFELLITVVMRFWIFYRKGAMQIINVIVIVKCYSWNIPVHADHTCVKANGVDPRFLEQRGKKVWAVEMSCPRVEDSGKKVEEKTAKYSPLRCEFRKRYPRYNID